MTYSALIENEPRTIRTPGFHHVARFRHVHPPACTASVRIGSCRQSMNEQRTEPGVDARLAALSHIVDQARNAR